MIDCNLIFTNPTQNNRENTTRATRTAISASAKIGKKKTMAKTRAAIFPGAVVGVTDFS